ncbi:MAG TPA: hypothetical protein VLZ84_08195 [Asticcacaulis sp.]|nr:hypothetical protein [Asticcacaulis sp.]
MSDKVLSTLIVIGFVNFVAFVGISLLIGGDALNGHVTDGHYYLANHGQLTEVDQDLYNYSRWHALSLLVTHPLAIIAMAMRAFRRKKSRAGQ